MSFWTKIISLFISFSLIVYIIRVIRTRKIREEYVILWLFTAVATGIVVIFENLAQKMARIIGAESDVVLITFFAFAYLLALVVHYSLRISDMMHNIKSLNQEVAILKNGLEELKSSACKNDNK